MPSAAHRASEGLSGRPASSWPRTTPTVRRPSSRPAAAVARRWLEYAPPKVTTVRPSAAARLGASLRHLFPTSSGWIRSSRFSSSRTPCRSNRASTASCRGEGRRGRRPVGPVAEGGSALVTAPLSPVAAGPARHGPARRRPGGGPAAGWPGGGAAGPVTPGGRPAVVSGVPVRRTPAASLQAVADPLAHRRHGEPARVHLPRLPLQVPDHRAFVPAVV